MTPQGALREQIKKNEQILALVRADSVPGITAEGRAHKERELVEITIGLRQALELLDVSQL